jgi:hypothetical protein
MGHDKQKRAITAGQRTQLAAARTKLAATGKSPRQIGIESRHKVFQFVYRFGFTTPNLLLLLLGRTSAGYGRKLAKKGWLISTKTESGIPAAFYTLSALGLQEAERHTVKLYPYHEISPNRVDQKLIRHDLIAQTATAQILNAGLISEYETPRMLPVDGSNLKTKLPDVVWTLIDGLRVATEVELNSKWGRDLDDLVMRIIRSLQSVDGQRPKFDRFAVITDSQAIIDNYRAAMKPGATVCTWVKNSRKHWVIDKKDKVPAWLIDKVDFRLLGGK